MLKYIILVIVKANLIMKSNVEDLYTPADIKRVRELIKKENSNICQVTGLPLTKAVLDHCHDDEQLVRGVIQSEINVVLGVIERGHMRYLRHWCSIPLSELLRKFADYLDESDKQVPRFRHNHWLKKIQAKFNKLSEPQKRSVLLSLGQPEGSNGVERKKLFQSVLKSKQHGFVELQDLIKEVSE